MNNACKVSMVISFFVVCDVQASEIKELENQLAAVTISNALSQEAEELAIQHMMAAQISSNSQNLMPIFMGRELSGNAEVVGEFKSKHNLNDLSGQKLFNLAFAAHGRYSWSLEMRPDASGHSRGFKKPVFNNPRDKEFMVKNYGYIEYPLCANTQTSAAESAETNDQEPTQEELEAKYNE